MSPTGLAGAGVRVALVAAVESTQPTVADPGLGATVATPPAWALIAGWVVGIILLAVLWALARR